MPASKFLGSALCGLFLIVAGAVAQVDDSAMQTDWMEFVKGSRDSESGAEVVEVDEGGEDGTRTVTLAIPKKSVKDPADIEEVVVIGQAPEEKEPMGMDISYEWVSDYDEDNYGLIIRLSEDTNWPIRLYLNSAPGFVR